MIARELIALPPFADEVEAGLVRYPKSLPCKLFYDSTGSDLFEQITRLPEYYLTRTELSILRDHAGEMASAIGSGITVVELGAGTAEKTMTLLRALAGRQIRVNFYPVDISPASLAQAQKRVQSQSPQISVRPVVADFSQGFGFLREIPGRKIILYLGSSIGNFDPPEAVSMLEQIHAQLSSEDALLLGTDLVKREDILVAAYNDSKGITERFNKNILDRLNRELGADFNLEWFRHVAEWNPLASRMEIFLESLRPQNVHVSLLNLRVRFGEGERIHTENSYKYTLTMVNQLLEPAGFTLDRTWFDNCKWFGLHLARA